MNKAVAADYRLVIEATRAGPGDRQTVTRLRRTLRAIRARDYFSPPERTRAERAVETLAQRIEARR
jgi:hypothetical protein